MRVIVLNDNGEVVFSLDTQQGDHQTWPEDKDVEPVMQALEDAADALAMGIIDKHP